MRLGGGASSIPETLTIIAVKGEEVQKGIYKATIDKTKEKVIEVVKQGRLVFVKGLLINAEGDPDDYSMSCYGSIGRGVITLSAASYIIQDYSAIFSSGLLFQEGQWYLVYQQLFPKFSN